MESLLDTAAVDKLNLGYIPANALLPEIVDTININFDRIKMHGGGDKGKQGDSIRGLPGRNIIGDEGEQGDRGAQLKFINSVVAHEDEFSKLNTGYVVNDIIMDVTGSFFQMMQHSSVPDTLIAEFLYNIGNTITANNFITTQTIFDSAGVKPINKWYLRDTGQPTDSTLVAAIRNTDAGPNDNTELLKLVIGDDGNPETNNVSTTLINIIPSSLDGTIAKDGFFSQLSFKYRPEVNSEVTSTSGYVTYKELNKWESNPVGVDDIHFSIDNLSVGVNLIHDVTSSSESVVVVRGSNIKFIGSAPYTSVYTSSGNFNNTIQHVTFDFDTDIVMKVTDNFFIQSVNNDDIQMDTGSGQLYFKSTNQINFAGSGVFFIDDASTVDINTTTYELDNTTSNINTTTTNHIGSNFFFNLSAELEVNGSLFDINSDIVDINSTTININGSSGFFFAADNASSITGSAQTFDLTIDGWRNIEITNVIDINLTSTDDITLNANDDVNLIGGSVIVVSPIIDIGGGSNIVTIDGNEFIVDSNLIDFNPTGDFRIDGNTSTTNFVLTGNSWTLTTSGAQVFDSNGNNTTFTDINTFTVIATTIDLQGALSVDGLTVAGNLNVTGNYQMDGDIIINNDKDIQNVKNIEFTGDLKIDGDTIITTGKNIQNIGNITMTGNLVMDGTEIIDTNGDWEDGSKIRGENLWTPSSEANPVIRYNSNNATYNARNFTGRIKFYTENNLNNSLLVSGGVHVDHQVQSPRYYIGNNEASGTLIIHDSGGPTMLNMTLVQSVNISGTTITGTTYNGVNIDVTGDIEGNTFSVGGSTIINSSGQWVGGDIGISGFVDANSYSINGTIVINSARNIVNVTSIDTSGNSDANVFRINGTTVITSGRDITNIDTITAASIDVSGNSDANQFRINGVAVINNGRNFVGNNVDVSGEVEANSFAINLVSIIDSSRNLININDITSIDISCDVIRSIFTSDRFIDYNHNGSGIMIKTTDDLRFSCSDLFEFRDRDNSDGIVSWINSTNGNYTNPSDIKLKSEIETLESSDIFNIINQLSPKSYNIKGTKQLGFIAQDIEKILGLEHMIDEVDFGENDGIIKSLTYNDFHAVSIAGIKAVKLEVDILKDEISDLKAEIELLKP